MLVVKAKNLKGEKPEAVVAFIWQEDGVKNSLIPELKQEKLVVSQDDDFSAERGEKRIVFLPDDSFAHKVVLVGLGEKKDFSLNALRNLAGETCRFATKYNIHSLGFIIGEKIEKNVPISLAAAVIAEGAALALYSFKKYKTVKDKHKPVKKITIYSNNSKLISDMNSVIDKALKLAKYVNFARDLVSEPANRLTPQEFASRIIKQAEEVGVAVDKFDFEDIKKEKMGGLLAVSSGSKCEPVFLQLKYVSAVSKRKKTICIVGKGVCFDRGGISIKPSGGMGKMKYDMAGAAACAEAVLAAASLELEHDVIGLIPLCENMPDSNAYRPGDVIKMHSSKTVEVSNTDAEGRLILADALSFSARLKPDVIIDLATLTGAAKVCLGTKAAAVLSNDNALVSDLIEAGEIVGEKLWQLPLWDEYQDDLKSEIADLNNISLKGAGTITAAKFLSNFVPENTSWAHIDIAAVAWEDDGKPVVPKGASGFGVRLLIEYLCGISGD